MESIDSQLQTHKAELIRKLSETDTNDTLNALEIEYLGRQGIINHLFKTSNLKSNPNLGKEINNFKNQVQDLLNQKRTELANTSKSKFDPTQPSYDYPLGSLHPITKAIAEIQEIFERAGFVRRRYQEVDTDWYYAEGLNIPKDHPARDDQETFYLENNTVLTAHTSNGQLHEMEHHKPPIKMTNIGKTYRRQADATHNSMFHQFEGLVIDKNISITNLIGVTEYFIKSYFGPERKVRLRPHHFQFTEPSFEIDISCGLCKGTGIVDSQKCKLCKSGWLELGGAGMVHPNVLRNGGVDPKKYSGFAFGWGVERVLMMKQGQSIPDLRLLFSDDIRLLNQI